MSLFKKQAKMTILSIERATNDDKSPVLVTIDGITYKLEPGEFSKALAKHGYQALAEVITS